jgi:hypothetical protein
MAFINILWVSTVFSTLYLFLDTAATSTRKFTEISRHKTSHMVLSIIFLEDKHKILLHLSIFYEYQQFFQHRICLSIQPPDYICQLVRSRDYPMYVHVYLYIYSILITTACMGLFCFIRFVKYYVYKSKRVPHLSAYM